MASVDGFWAAIHLPPHLQCTFGTLMLGPAADLGKHTAVRARQRVIATATVYLARFFYNNSYKDFHPHLIAATALYLASKVEESPVQVRPPSTLPNRSSNSGPETNAFLTLSALRPSRDTFALHSPQRLRVP